MVLIIIIIIFYRIKFETKFIQRIRIMWDKEYLEKIRKEKEKWDNAVESHKERTDLPFITDSGVPVKRLYTPLDVKSDYIENVYQSGCHLLP